MRMFWRLACAAAFLFTIGKGAWAQVEGSSDTVGELATACRMEGREFCYGYVNGAGQFYAVLANDDRLEFEPFVCPGREVSEDEAVSIFLDWVDDHPDAQSEAAIDGLFRAWVAAFPCE